MRPPHWLLALAVLLLSVRFSWAAMLLLRATWWTATRLLQVAVLLMGSGSFWWVLRSYQLQKEQELLDQALLKFKYYNRYRSRVGSGNFIAGGDYAHSPPPPGQHDRRWLPAESAQETAYCGALAHFLLADLLGAVASRVLEIDSSQALTMVAKSLELLRLHLGWFREAYAQLADEYPAVFEGDESDSNLLRRQEYVTAFVQRSPFVHPGCVGNPTAAGHSNGKKNGSENAEAAYLRHVATQLLTQLRPQLGQQHGTNVFVSIAMNLLREITAFKILKPLSDFLYKASRRSGEQAEAAFQAVVEAVASAASSAAAGAAVQLRCAVTPTGGRSSAHSVGSFNPLLSPMSNDEEEMTPRTANETMKMAIVRDRVVVHFEKAVANYTKMYDECPEMRSSARSRELYDLLSALEDFFMLGFRNHDSKTHSFEDEDDNKEPSTPHFLQTIIGNILRETDQVRRVLTLTGGLWRLSVQVAVPASLLFRPVECSGYWRSDQDVGVSPSNQWRSRSMTSPSTPVRVLERVWETERYVPMNGWVKASDKRWNELPSSEWVWEDDWTLENAAIDAGESSDSETPNSSWEYAKTFDDNFHEKEKKLDSVRRRRWIRRRLAPPSSLRRGISNKSIKSSVSEAQSVSTQPSVDDDPVTLYDNDEDDDENLCFRCLKAFPRPSPAWELAKAATNVCALRVNFYAFMVYPPPLETSKKARVCGNCYNRLVNKYKLRIEAHVGKYLIKECDRDMDTFTSNSSNGNNPTNGSPPSPTSSGGNLGDSVLSPLIRVLTALGVPSSRLRSRLRTTKQEKKCGVGCQACHLRGIDYMEMISIKPSLKTVAAATLTYEKRLYVLDQFLQQLLACDTLCQSSVVQKFLLLANAYGASLAASSASMSGWGETGENPISPSASSSVGSGVLGNATGGELGVGGAGGDEDARPQKIEVSLFAVLGEVFEFDGIGMKLSGWIGDLRLYIFPDPSDASVVPPPAPDIQVLRKYCLEAILASFPSKALSLFGDTACENAALKLHEFLQHEAFVKNLLFSITDELLVHLFPDSTHFKGKKVAGGASSAAPAPCLLCNRGRHHHR
ncbi:Peroxin/Ferlin domain [Phytophthora cactorum]|nr:Peroxin/Ferlin domain [Phytophthora cactorum]